MMLKPANDLKYGLSRAKTLTPHGEPEKVLGGVKLINQTWSNYV
jgi:hypothetical protein